MELASSVANVNPTSDSVAEYPPVRSYRNPETESGEIWKSGANTADRHVRIAYPTKTKIPVKTITLHAAFRRSKAKIPTRLINKTIGVVGRTTPITSSHMET